MGTPRSVLALIFVALALVACAPAVETPAPPTATIAPTTSSATSTPTATARRLQSPQPLASASLPAFVLNYERFSDILTISGPELLVTSDGALVSAPNWGMALSLRRLTPAGVDLLRNTVLDTGLFTATRAIARRLRPDVSPSALGRGYEAVSITIHTGDRDVRVTTFTRDRDDGLYIWDAGRDELLALAGRLGPLTWLPQTSWSDRTERPYVATFYRLYIETSRNTSDPLVSASVVSVWPFTVPPESFGTVVPADPSAPPSLTARCAILTAGDARALGDAIAGTTSFHPELRITSGKYRWPAGLGDVYLQLEPLLPHVAPTCDGVRYSP